jgi:dihydroxyacetone kinase DhaKLM complex PTS-EIIA-like component DhaM
MAENRPSSDITVLAEEVLAACEGLDQKRQLVTHHKFLLSAMRDTVAELKAQTEVTIIEAAGGEKGLGTNAEARERAFLIGLAKDQDYVKALAAMELQERESANAQDDLAYETERQTARRLVIHATIATYMLLVPDERKMLVSV